MGGEREKARIMVHLLPLPAAEGAQQLNYTGSARHNNSQAPVAAVALTVNGLGKAGDEERGRCIALVCACLS